MNNLALKTDATGITSVASAKPFEIRRLHGQPSGYELVLNGFLAPGWTGRLAAALSQHRISIVRGEAEKVTASSWRSRFELKTAPFAKDPLSLDFTALAATELPSQRSTSQIALLDFVMSPNGEDGTLELEVTGIDRLGFLGDLLDYFSMRCLFPVKMTVETVADQAVDRFWLRGVGGSRPSESITAAIRENLEKLLLHKA